MLLSCRHIPVPTGPTGNPNTQSIHISSYWDYVQSGTGLHKNTGLNETDPLELTWINSPTPHLLTQNAHPGLPTPATIPTRPPSSGRFHCGGSADGVSDIGHFHILVWQVVTAELEHQCFHVLAQLLFGHLCHNLGHPVSTQRNILEQWKVLKKSILLLLTADQASLWAWQQAWRMNKAWRLPETAWWSPTCVHSLKKQQQKNS